MDFIDIICNVILSVIFASSFICIFFFTHGKNVEREVVINNLTYIVNSLLSSPIALFKNSPEYNYANNQLSALKPSNNDLEADSNVIKNNNDLMKKSFIYIGILLFIGLILVFILSIYKNRNNDIKSGLIYFFILILKNLFMTSGIGLTEFIFLKFVASQYMAADDNVIIKQVLINISKLS